MDNEQFGVRPVTGRELRRNNKMHISSTVFKACRLRDMYWRPLRLSELRTEMNFPLTRSLGELWYTKRLENLYWKISFGFPSVFERAYCCLDSSYHKSLSWDIFKRCER